MRHPIDLPPNNLLFDQSLYIRELQEYLRYLSFYDASLPEIGVDGIYGRETAEAVAAFQELYQMDPTGRVDRVTWDLIYALYRAILFDNTKQVG